MAGIGFELRKLFQKSGLLNNMKAYAYSATVTIGPTLFAMLVIVVLQRLLARFGVPFAERELFMATVVYAFIFSMLLTNGLIMLVTRHVSDHIFLKNARALIGSWYGVMVACLVVGGAAGIAFLSFSPLAPAYKGVAYLLFMILIVVWTQSLFFSALQQYMKVVRAFAVGMLISLGLALLFVAVIGWKTAIAVLVALTAGFLVAATLLMLELERAFWTNHPSPLGGFVSSMKKYPSLIWIGTFSMLGLYVHLFLYWRSPEFGVTVEDTFRIAPFYDSAVFHAFLTVLPTMVLFVVSLETRFYLKYKAYYQTVLGGGTIEDILRSRREMVIVMMQEVGFLMGVQLVFSILGIALGIKLLPRIGFSPEQLETFNMLVVGFYVYITGTVLQLLLLYFDDRKGVLWITFFFAAGNAALTHALMPYGAHGLSFFAASFLMVIASLLRLIHFLRNVNYHTFSAQPLFADSGRRRGRRLPETGPLG